MAEPPEPSDPSKLIFQSDSVRRSIFAAYWLVIILALPLWWYTTSIQRLHLPAAQVAVQSSRQLRLPVNVELSPEARALTVVDELQALLDRRTSTEPMRWNGVDVKVGSSAAGGQHDEPSVYTVNLVGSTISLQNRGLKFPLKDLHSVHRLADLLADLLVSYPTSSSEEFRVVQYAPRYRLAFTLLNEDASEGRAAIGWDVQRAISSHITPIVDSLSLLHNFTVESQAQFYAPLAFGPQQFASNTEDIYVLTPEDLTVFVNSAEWTLSSSVSNDPVLHFLLFVPTSSRRPLHILDDQGHLSDSHAFLLPQWGGVVVFNPPADLTDHFHLDSSTLDPIFSSFAHQLLALLGVRPLPKGFESMESGSVVTGWQFDALVRRRTLENVRGSQETLKSTIELVKKIENMPIGESVRNDVFSALSALDKVYAMSAISPTAALRHSSEAASLASRAFFDPGMLALLYFPPEHKYAVYAPLFASALLPPVVAVLRELVAWRRARRQPRAVEAREKDE